MNATTFLSSQSAEYQHHLSLTNELTTTLNHQWSIQTYKSIPRRYQPTPLKASDPSLIEQFNKEYDELFFKYLKKVITNNEIKLELHKCTLTNIIVQTETHISKLPLPAEELQTLYNKFLTENHIENRIPIPELQKCFESDNPKINYPKRKRRQKRKCPAPTPGAVKHNKPSHFLSPGPQEMWTPP